MSSITAAADIVKIGIWLDSNNRFSTKLKIQWIIYVIGTFNIQAYSLKFLYQQNEYITKQMFAINMEKKALEIIACNAESYHFIIIGLLLLSFFPGIYDEILL